MRQGTDLTAFNPQIAAIAMPNKSALSTTGEALMKGVDYYQGQQLKDLQQKRLDMQLKKETLDYDVANELRPYNLETAKANSRNITSLANSNEFKDKTKEEDRQNDINNKDRDFALNKEKLEADIKRQDRDFDLRTKEFNVNTDFKNQTLNLQREELGIKKQEQANKDKAEAYELLANPSYFAQQSETHTIDSKLDNIMNKDGMNVKTFSKAYGVLDGGIEKVKGAIGKNANTESDDILKIMSDKIYRDKARRDTAYNRENHDSIFRQPDAWKPEGANKANAIKIVTAYYNSEAAEINDYYNQKMTTATALKNPAFQKLFIEARDKDLALLNEKKEKAMNFYSDIEQPEQKQDPNKLNEVYNKNTTGRTNSMFKASDFSLK